MAFKSIVILGGGPIGLMAAIEASQYFKYVTIVEKRTQYTRSNVPVLQDNLKEYLSKSLKIDKQLGWKKQSQPTVPFAKLEEALWDKARHKGVERLTGWVVETIQGVDKKQNGMYKSMVLILRRWDPVKKKVVGTDTVRIEADLLIVATGGGAINDPVIQGLGFRWETLKAKNYAAYGVFVNPDGPPPEIDLTLKQKLNKPVEGVVPGKSGSGKTDLRTKDHNYLLVTLVGITRNDYRQLQENQGKLRTLLTSIGHSVSGTVLQQLKPDVERNVALFKVRVQRAQQFYSSEYPAVLVGDAAVTPHPETGSGMVTGFKGIEELTRLFAALSRTHRCEDNLSLFLNFDASFELHVAEKTLKGTYTILYNLRKSVDIFRNDVIRQMAGMQHPFAKAALREMEQIADDIMQDLTSEMNEAEGLVNVLQGKSAPNLDPRASVARLWSEIALTYASIKRFTGDLGFLDEKMHEIERHLH